MWQDFFPCHPLQLNVHSHPISPKLLFIGRRWLPFSRALTGALLARSLNEHQFPPAAGLRVDDVQKAHRGAFGLQR